MRYQPYPGTRIFNKELTLARLGYGMPYQRYPTVEIPVRMYDRPLLVSCFVADGFRLLSWRYTRPASSLGALNELLAPGGGKYFAFLVNAMNSIDDKIETGEKDTTIYIYVEL